ncbi:MAG: peptidoglycan DD-metalloendopeptidase family protein [Alphaproteobacteria bacterium]|nr:peptidoglycan DD-metalloendopeptidase family protein [Alphaproteobacteria bacterium]
MRPFLLLIAGVLVVAMSGAALAPVSAAESKPDDPEAAAEALKRIESDLASGKADQAQLQEIARELAAQVERIRTQMRETAANAQKTEETMSRVENRLAELEAEAAEKRARLSERGGELAALTGALQRLARRPAGDLMAIDRPPMETVRTGLLLESAIPRINAEAERLKAELAGLVEVEADILAQRRKLAGATDELNLERARLAELADEKTGLLAATTERKAGAAEQVAALSKSAKSLSDLLTKLQTRSAEEKEEQSRLSGMVTPGAASVVEDGTPIGTTELGPTPDRGEPLRLALLPQAAPIGSFKGQLIAPSSGRLIKRYGEPDAEGLRDHGFVLRTRPGALVVAPYDGRVIHVGHFAGLGTILIIEHGDGYHTLMGGLGRLEVGLDQRLLAGEPIGVMGADGEAAAELYLELRHNGDPIDPYPWFSGLSEQAEG